MFVRRRRILGMGCIMAVFGLSPEALGLVFNLASDVGGYCLQHEQVPRAAAVGDRGLRSGEEVGRIYI
jgi:hypothetical protein